ncbi:hypothetical protein L1987_00323 [Smallanthus sonchifolius]|uniref:Uncharacterized protein n=1 Tax=Smallanthus sonchifolius TaxID=185202 RepID=A0ACB9K207_9ASTR|nr:hypothetical protein L1987_00323 [Smallanthus sonchifolius]
MKDPVTLSTGITYDRDSIEKWLFSQKKGVCPVTKQVVLDIELTPNHTLRRFQSWCALNPSSGVQKFPTPQLPITKTEIIKLLEDSKSPHLQIYSLKRLKTIVLENEKNKRLMESVGAADYLTSILNNMNNSIKSSSPAGETTGADDALSILYHLKLSPTGLKSLFEKEGAFVETMTNLMQRAAGHKSRAYAVMLMKSMLEVAEPMQLTSLNPNFFLLLVQILRDQISKKAKSDKSGGVCECAEGRAELLKHGGGLAVVSKKIFRVSSVASEKAVRILHSVAKFSGNKRVLQEMLELGVVGKLCLVVQVDCGKKMKENAREILKMHFRVWKDSSCIPYNLISSYPSLG